MSPSPPFVRKTWRVVPAGPTSLIVSLADGRSGPIGETQTTSSSAGSTVSLIMSTTDIAEELDEDELEPDDFDDFELEDLDELEPDDFELEDWDELEPDDFELEDFDESLLEELDGELPDEAEDKLLPENRLELDERLLDDGLLEVLS